MHISISAQKHDDKTFCYQ